MNNKKNEQLYLIAFSIYLIKEFLSNTMFKFSLPPVNAPAADSAFPLWSNTMAINSMHTIINITLYIFPPLLP